MEPKSYPPVEACKRGKAPAIGILGTGSSSRVHRAFGNVCPVTMHCCTEPVRLRVNPFTLPCRPRKMQQVGQTRTAKLAAETTHAKTSDMIPLSVHSGRSPAACFSRVARVVPGQLTRYYPRSGQSRQGYGHHDRTQPEK